VINPFFEYIQRQSAGIEHFIVERPDVELRA